MCGDGRTETGGAIHIRLTASSKTDQNFFEVCTPKNLAHRSITTLKYIKIRQPRPEIEGVSKFTLTVKHPVVV